jgi:M6 family metalloprotease-like protein
MRPKRLVRKLVMLLTLSLAISSVIIVSKNGELSASSLLTPDPAPTSAFAWADAAWLGYVWANQPAASSYTPDPNYTYNGSGRGIQITRNSVGSYAVRFADLSSVGSGGGHVQVTAYGPGNERCKVESWDSLRGGDFTASVRCFDTAGNPVDTRYTVLVSKPLNRVSNLGYAWANQPTASRYTPNPNYAYNGSGRDIQITRNSVGSYAVRFAGFGGGGNVQVTAYGPGNEHCKVGEWDPYSVNFIAYVRCFNTAGNPVDTSYTILVSKGRELRPFGYAWANRPTAGSYTPEILNSYNGSNGNIRITRERVGSYAVRFAKLGDLGLGATGTEGGHVKVTAAGRGNEHCKVQSWDSLGVDFVAYVRCFKNAGGPVDTSYTILVNYSQQRLLIDQLGEPFQSLKRIREPRKIITILWDWHGADPALDRDEIVDALFGDTNSVHSYFLENSNRYFNLESAGVLGWYDAKKPFTYYGCPHEGYTENQWFESIGCPPEGFNRDEGWLNGHVEKWAEAIRLADADFNFAAHDNNGDGILSPDELGIAIVIPANNPFGTVRRAVGREVPYEPLVVDGVQVGDITEFYIGNPPHRGLMAHELSHLLLGTPDMYFWFFNPAAAGHYSLMDNHGNTTHLDPFHKLKFGWARPQIIFSDGRYSLSNVQQSNDVLVLLDPTRGTDEYFLVENRWRDENSFDRGIYDDGGLAVWHIMEKPEVYGSVSPPPNVKVENWDQVLAHDWGRRAIRMIRPILTPPFDDGHALWDRAQAGTDYDLLSEDPDPNHAQLHWADGSPSGFALRDISAAGRTMEVTIDVPNTP